MLRSFVCALVVALPAAADAPDPSFPAPYAVTGVAPDDQLNIRAAPTAAADLRGALAHDDPWVEVLGLSREGRWAMVNTAETSGWVSARFLTPQPVPRDELGLPRTLTCFGTEPFWSARFEPSTFLLSTPEHRTVAPLTAVSPSAANVDLADTGLLFEWGFSGRAVQAHILPGRCTDGMSDRVYGLHYVDNVLGHGCCSIDE